MAGPGLLGLTWDHPRGYAALAELERLDARGEHPYGSVSAPLHWERQPLEGFESEPLAGLAERYDVLVLDHPGLPEGVASDSLVAMEELFRPSELAAWSKAFAGPSWASYEHRGRQWALPLDAATQIAVSRPDALGDEPAPTTWPGVLELARASSLALCLGGPHAFLMFLALCVAVGAEPRPEPDGPLVPEAAGLRVLETMAELLSHADPRVSSLNPIGMLDAMSQHDGPAYCPLVYGYVTYHRPPEAGRRLRAHGAPSWSAGGRPGTVLGGTGLAVSRRCSDLDAAREHLRRLVDPQVQGRLIPSLGGQPSARPAWHDPEVDGPAGGFFSATRASLDAAWVRPRRAGYVAFQGQAGELVRQGLLTRQAPASLLEQLETPRRRLLVPSHPPEVRT